MMSRCNKPDDWNLTPLDVDFTFNNETDSSISFTIVNYITYEDVMVRLSPKSSSEVFSFEAETDKVPDVNDCWQELLIDVYATRGLEGISKIITLNDTLCVEHLDQGSVLLANYAHEVIEKNHFRYTYTFTREDFMDVIDCN